MVSSVTNYNRISGLASGLDTDTLVKQMVQAQSTNLIKLQQQKTLNSWKTDTYRDINTKIDDFRKTVQDLRLQGTFMKKTATSAQPNLVGASISGSPTSSSYAIEVGSLATTASVSFEIDKNKISGRTAEVGSDFSFELTGDPNDPNKTFTINVSSKDTVDQVISRINEQSKTTGVKALYFDGNGSIIFTTTSSGSNANIKIKTSGTNNLGIVSGTTAQNDPGSTQFSTGQEGMDGNVIINGVSLPISSNTFTFDGIKFDLKGTTNGQKVSIQVANDTQAAFDSIKNFVDKYNQLIDELNKKISEKKYRDFLPLTDDQKKDMKDNDIKNWEEKAKSGLLSNDSTISDFLLKLRNSLMQPVDGINLGDPKSLSDIGIKTSNIYQERGKLILDETKLKSMLDSNLDGVKMLFSKQSKIGSSTETTITNPAKMGDSGLGYRMYDQVNSTLKQFINIVGSLSSSNVNPNSVMGKQLKYINSNLDKEQRRIYDYESNLYKKFAAMEKSLSKLNSQSSWLSQQLGR